MPSSYTSKVASGCSFKEFAIKCSEQFIGEDNIEGKTLYMVQYYEKRLERAKADLGHFCEVKHNGSLEREWLKAKEERKNRREEERQKKEELKKT